MGPIHHHIEDFASSIIKCKKEKNLATGLQLHCHLGENGLDVHPLGNDLVSMLVDVGGIVYARQVFNRLAYRNGRSLSSLIAGYVKHGEPNHAIALYQKLQKDDPLCVSSEAFVALLKASAILRDLETGSGIHIEVVRKGLLEKEVFLGNTLVHMYAQCGLFTKAEEVVAELPFQSVVLWNALIAGYVEHGHSVKVFELLEQMECNGISPNAVTLVCSLKACGSIGALVKGCEIHAELAIKGFLEENVFVSSALVDMYAKCGSVENAQEVFKSLQSRNVVLWNALITGYLEHKHGQEAINCFELMQCEGLSPDAVTFVCILKACSSTGATEKGQEMHTEIVRKGLERELLIGITLVNFYAKCGLLPEAQEVFDKIQSQSVVSWTALIAGYASYGYGEKALYFYERMCNEAVSPDSSTFVCSLAACASIEATHKGQEMHAEVIRRGLLDRDVFIGSALVGMYAKGGFLEEAHSVFTNLLVKDVVLWNALIAGYVEHGYGQEALQGFEHMQHEGMFPDATTLVCCLKACSSIGAIMKGSQIHSEVVKQGLLESELYNTLVDFYAKSNLFSDALKVLDEIPSCDAVPWNAVITGYIEQGFYEHALFCLDKMQQKGISLDVLTLVLGLKACGIGGAIIKGQELHVHSTKIGMENELLIGNTLIDVYAKFNLLVEAQDVFNKLQSQSIVSWNSLIAGYTEHGHGDTALDCFDQLEGDGLSSDTVTLVCSLKACCTIVAIDEGQQIHLLITKKGLERELLVGNTLVDMYAKCGLLVEAEDLLQKLPVRAAVSWTALILGYAGHGYLKEALCCFNKMQSGGLFSDVITLFCSLTVCGTLGATTEGRDIHAEIVKRGYLESEKFSGSNLVDMYVKWGSLAEAQSLCNTLPVRDTISWNVLMTGYIERRCSEDAIYCFEQMQQEGVPWDSISLVCALVACGNLGAMARAQEIHVEIVKRGLEKEPFVGNTVVNMYAKCGLLATAHGEFIKLMIQDSVSWNALIVGYGQLGESTFVLVIFDKMVKNGIRPDATTFVNVLNSCSHGGLVDMGQMCFEAIDADYGFVPTQEHFNCLVDLLGRAGQLENALVIIQEMPYHPNIMVWHTVLGACRKWSNLELGRHAFEHAVLLNVRDAAAYAYMSNIITDAATQEFASVGMQ